MPNEILSKDNPLVKEAKRLKASAKDRNESKKYFIEGARLCSDAALSGCSIERLFYTDEAMQKYAQAIEDISTAAKEVYYITDEIAGKLSDTVNPQGIFCICNMPDCPVTPENAELGKYIALENIQDPANMGTILRTAEAFGFTEAIISKDCCDIYNTKVIRGSMGAVFRIPVRTAENFPEHIKKMRASGLRPIAAVTDSDASKITAIRFFKGVVMCIGNEGSGLTEDTVSACGERVTIPMSGKAESLNAATSASILMWEMVRSD